MKSTLALALASIYTLVLVFVSLSTLAVASLDTVYQGRRDGCDPNGWVQKKQGCASFTSAHNCATPCKLYAYFRDLVLHVTHAEHDILLQRAA
jgi:hypothetical protein